MTNKKTINPPNIQDIKVGKPRKESDYSKSVGVLMFLVCVSIGYMAVMIGLGTKGYTAKAMCVPAVLFAAVYTIGKFMGWPSRRTR